MEAGSRDVVADLHRLYYHRWVWQQTYWLGVQVMKCPLDLWIYQEIVHRTKPDTIIETGTWEGGSALYLASVCDALNHGRVVSIDLEARGQPEHPRVTYIDGSSTDPAIVAKANLGGRTMVILDSDHSTDHVLSELNAYAPLVSPGCYLIVEDTNIGHEIGKGRSGPREAVTPFLAETDAFEVDRECEKFMLTFNPSGYLRRTS